MGKISGAVGTFAHVPPEVEEEVCRALGLEPEPVSTQVVQRDRHAELVATCAIVGGGLERIATEIRSLQRTEILEAEEPFGEGQKGSSAMPHKRNPWLCEQVTGLARVLRAHAGAALEDIALWHERDISHSSVERIVLPDATILLDYLLGQTVRILDGLRVYPERMRENLERSYGLVYSQRVLLALTEAGLRARRPTGWSSGTPCGRGRSGGRSWSASEADPEVTERLGPEALKACFDPGWYLRHVDAVFRRVGLGRGGADDVKARIVVRLRPGILDPQGATIQRALEGLGSPRCATSGSARCSISRSTRRTPGGRGSAWTRCAASSSPIR